MGEHRSKHRIRLAALLPGFFASTHFAFASSPGTTIMDPSVAVEAAIAPAAIINQDLSSKAKWDAHPTIGYFTGSTTVDIDGNTDSVSGWGGTLQAQYPWNEHAGISLSGLGYKGSGTYSGAGGGASVSGWFVGAAFVLDPTSGQGFRIPFFIGLNYQSVKSATPQSNTFTAMTLNSPGYTFGFSPRFNVGDIRVEPFLVITPPFEEGNQACAANVSGSACGKLSISTLPIYGVNFVYRPWELSFFVNFSSMLTGSGASFYSLGPRFTF